MCLPGAIGEPTSSAIVPTTSGCIDRRRRLEYVTTSPTRENAIFDQVGVDPHRALVLAVVHPGLSGPHRRSGPRPKERQVLTRRGPEGPCTTLGERLLAVARGRSAAKRERKACRFSERSRTRNRPEWLVAGKSGCGRTRDLSIGRLALDIFDRHGDAVPRVRESYLAFTQPHRPRPATQKEDLAGTLDRRLVTFPGRIEGDLVFPQSIPCTSTLETTNMPSRSGSSRVVVQPPRSATPVKATRRTLTGTPYWRDQDETGSLLTVMPLPLKCPYDCQDSGVRPGVARALRARSDTHPHRA